MSAFAPERANPQSVPTAWLGACGVMVAIGVLSFFGGLAADADIAWRAYHVNFLYWGAIAQAGLCISCAFVIIGAKWPGPVRHVAEGLAAWVPVSVVLCAIQWFGREAIYTNWIHGAPPGKESYLNITRLYVTDLAILGVLAVLTVIYLKSSFRPTLAGAAERATQAQSRFAAWTTNWRGDAEELAESRKKLTRLAPIIALLYVFGWSFIAFDQVMSLTPTWFSNIFGWYFTWGAWLSAIALTALICVLLRRGPAWAAEITKDRMHDLGKMIFAFCVFWMYLFFSQYIVIWYGNLPEETQFFQSRLGSQFLQDSWYIVAANFDEPYVKLSLTAWIGCWVVPFWVLLGEQPKRTPAILGTVSALVLLGFWLERNALVWPSLVPDDGGAWFGGIQLGIALGFAGAFAAVFLIFSRVFPTLPLPVREDH